MDPHNNFYGDVGGPGNYDTPEPPEFDFEADMNDGEPHRVNYNEYASQESPAQLGGRQTDEFYDDEKLQGASPIHTQEEYRGHQEREVKDEYDEDVAMLDRGTQETQIYTQEPSLPAESEIFESQSQKQNALSQAYEYGTQLPTPSPGTYQEASDHSSTPTRIYQYTTQPSQQDDMGGDPSRTPTPTPTRNYLAPHHSTINDIGLGFRFINIDDASDDDIRAIDPAEAPLRIQEKWRQHIPSRPRPLENVCVKQEPIAQLSNADRAKESLAKLRRIIKDKGKAVNPVPKTPPEARQQKNLEQIDSAMGGTEEDHDWMGQEDPDEDREKDQKTLDSLLAEQQQIIKRQSHGLAKAEDRLKLASLNAKIIPLERKMTLIRRGLQCRQEEESLFMTPVPDDHRDDVINDHRRNRPQRAESQDDFDAQLGLQQTIEESLRSGASSGIQEDKGIKKNVEPQKRRPKGSSRPTNAREYYVQKGEKERSKSQKKRTREAAKIPTGKGKQKATNSPPKGKCRKGKDAAGKPKGKGKGKKSTAKGRNHQIIIQRSGFKFGQAQPDPLGELLCSIGSDNPIQERLTNPIFNGPAEQEIYGRQVKETQFQRLFANIPTQEEIGGMGSGREGIAADKAKLREASKSFGHAKVKAENGKWRLSGMISPLYHHQLLGAQWMVSREFSAHPPHGGILADSMGLGKTVQTLACLVGNPSQKHHIAKGQKATLIVVPTSVIGQWINEIRAHCKPETFRKVMHYKHRTAQPQAIVEDCDIVVTGYSDVMREFPSPSTTEDWEVVQRVGKSKWAQQAGDRLGVLHKINWFRVVIDEAQIIKNNDTRTSLACQNLKAIYRWCLTGTPLLNRLEELFPYLRFLRADYSINWPTFKKYFCDPNAVDSFERIDTLLSYTMMRRTMATTILNRPIIVLPKPKSEILMVEFSREEKIIYRITENRFRCNVNMFFQRGTAGHNYSAFMVQLLRLRQMTSHPFMLERTIKEMWTLEDIQMLRNELQALRDDEPVPFYTQIKAWMDHTALDREAAIRSGQNPNETILMTFGQSKFGHDFNMDKALTTLNNKNAMERLVCKLCFDLPVRPVQTDCGHIFCEECLTERMHQNLVDDQITVCPYCDNIFTHVQALELPPILRGDDEDVDSVSPSQSQSQSQSRGKLKGKGRARDHEAALRAADKIDSKGKDALGWEPKTPYSNWVSQSDWDPDFPLVPSAKTATVKSLLLKAFREPPKKDEAPDKVVIYLQWRTLARILGRMCNGEKWGFVYLFGDSTTEQRDRILRKFKEDPDVRILIAGLKCGGIGLNLAFANRCISLDLWWNHAIESQAFGRIFRIGQAKESFFTRIVVERTVDTRLLALQMHKLKFLDRAMKTDEDASHSTPSLSIHQLASLFGFLKTDEDGEISVEEEFTPEGNLVGVDDGIEELEDEQFDSERAGEWRSE